MTAGIVLIREAGGQVTTADGGPLDPFRPDILATNGLIHRELLDVLTAARPG